MNDGNVQLATKRSLPMVLTVHASVFVLERVTLDTRPPSGYNVSNNLQTTGAVQLRFGHRAKEH